MLECGIIKLVDGQQFGIMYEGPDMFVFFSNNPNPVLTVKKPITSADDTIEIKIPLRSVVLMETVSETDAIDYNKLRSNNILAEAYDVSFAEVGNTWGLSHPIQHLEEIENDIPFWPLAKQAQYADAVIQTRVNDNEWLQEQMSDEPDNAENWNATAVGNLAYIIIHTTSSKIQATALKHLAVIRGYARRRHGNDAG